MNETTRKVGLPLLVLAAGVLTFAVLTVSKREPEAKMYEVRGALVETLTAEVTREPVIIAGHGTVHPRYKASISPQVSGQVIWLADVMVEGGFFTEGEPLFRIDASDYESAVAAAQAELAASQKDLEVARANARIAVEEWRTMRGLVGEAEPDEPNSLVLYEPQLRSAEARVAAKRAALKKARLDLQRTTAAAPFNGFIRKKNFDLGQYVRPGDAAAEMVGTDAVEVIVPLGLDDRAWLVRGSGSARGLPAVVSLDVGGRTVRWKGVVARFPGDVDARGRMNRVVISVSNPYFENGDPNTARPVALAVGMFVRVEIDAGELEQTIALPRSALRAGTTLWLLTDESTLAIREVEVARLTKERVYIKSGLQAGERVILTGLPGAAPGMKLRSAKTE